MNNHSEPLIIDTFAKLKQLDPDTFLGIWHEDIDEGYIVLSAHELLNEKEYEGWNTDFAFVVIATGEQVRAAKQALESR